MEIKKETKRMLYMAQAWCDYEDKSTEFMIEFMADFAEVDHDTVMSFLQYSTENERAAWYKHNPNWRAEFRGIMNAL